jgi:hypothetical protein
MDLAEDLTQDPSLTKAGLPRKGAPGHGGPRTGPGGVREGAGRPTKTEQADAYTLLAKAKAKRETYRAQMAEVEYRTRIGELLEASVVAETWAAQVAIAKGRLLALPARIAPSVIGLGDLRAIEGVIREAIHEALTELSENG